MVALVSMFGLLILLIPDSIRDGGPVLLFDLGNIERVYNIV